MTTRNKKVAESVYYKHKLSQVLYVCGYSIMYIMSILYKNKLQNVDTLCIYIPVAILAAYFFIVTGKNPGYLDLYPLNESEVDVEMQDVSKKQYEVVNDEQFSDEEEERMNVLMPQ